MLASKLLKGKSYQGESEAKAFCHRRALPGATCGKCTQYIPGLDTSHQQKAWIGLTCPHIPGKTFCTYLGYLLGITISASRDSTAEEEKPHTNVGIFTTPLSWTSVHCLVLALRSWGKTRNVSEQYFRVSTEEHHIINVNNNSAVINDVRPYPLCKAWTIICEDSSFNLK